MGPVETTRAPGAPCLIGQGSPLVSGSSPAPPVVVVPGRRSDRILNPGWIAKAR